jgi:hypothetical protein
MGKIKGIYCGVFFIGKQKTVCSLNIGKMVGKLMGVL